MRAAIQVDAVVAEIRANVVEIVHRDIGRVETNVGVVAGETAFNRSRLDSSGSVISRSEFASDRQFSGFDFPVPR